MKLIKTTLLLLGVSACSSQAIYDTTRNNAQMECQKLPQNQYENCMENVAEEYESYSRKREEVVGEE